MKTSSSAQRGFVWLPILLGVLLVLAVSGGAYWYGQQKPQTQVDNSQQEVQNQAATLRIDSITPSTSAADGSTITIRGVGFNSGLPDSNDIVIFKNSSREVSSPPESVSPDGTTITLKLSTGIAEGSYQVSVGVARAAQDRPGSMMVKSNSVPFTVTGSQSASVPGTGEMPAEKTCSDTGTCWVTINAAGTETDVSVRVPPEYKKVIALSVQPGSSADEKLFGYVKSLTTQNTGMWLQYHYGDAGCSATKYYHDWSSTSAKQTVIVWVSFCEGENVTPPSENLMLQILSTLIKG